MAIVELIVPVVHLNGTSKQDLLKAMEGAYSALGDAYDKLREMAPNARDYYVTGPDAYARAAKEHRHRMMRVDAIRTEIEALVGSVDDREPFVTVEIYEGLVQV
jgi:hypothetical protein